jgi:hypothetical protein
MERDNAPGVEEEEMVEAGQANRADEALLVQRDWRADGGSRRVRVTRAGVLITRRFGGVDMRIAVPAPAYRGVALDVAGGGDGAPCYRLSLVHRDRDLDVTLLETDDSAIAAADWTDWADWLGLPRLAAGSADVVEIDAGERPAPVPRRGGSALRRRRPLFLARRKTGDIRRLAAIFAGEREIIARD